MAHNLYVPSPMPRKRLEMTHEYPYHIVARSNNRAWFYLPTQQCWSVFVELLLEISLRFSFQTHAFVLMNNHYHLIGSTSENHPLSRVMEWFQRTANRKINDQAGRINHLFGGPYKASLIKSEDGYFHAIKYLYRNPVKAGIVQSVEEYEYSSLKEPRIPLVTPITGIAIEVPTDFRELLGVLNQSYSSGADIAIGHALKKSEFEISSRLDQATRKELCCGQSQ